MGYILTGWDKTTIKVESSNVQDARTQARTYLSQWMEKGDQVLFFRGEKEGDFVAVVYAYGEHTDASCKIKLERV